MKRVKKSVGDSASRYFSKTFGGTRKYRLVELSVKVTSNVPFDSL